MSASQSQLSLSEDANKLKKSCICKDGNRRCTRKRRHAGEDETYQELLDGMTIHWTGLDEMTRKDTAIKFADYSVCATHFNEGRHHAVAAALLAEKLAMESPSPFSERRTASTPTRLAIANTTPHMRSASLRRQTRGLARASTFSETADQDDGQELDESILAASNEAGAPETQATAGSCKSSENTLKSPH